jgi:hypothetical protein
MYIVVVGLVLDLGFMLVWFSFMLVVGSMPGEKLQISLARSAVP